MRRRKFIQTFGITPFIGNLKFSDPANHNPKSLTAIHAITSDEPKPHDFFYKPTTGWAADFIPLYTKGKFELFYLLDFRDSEKHGEGTPWYRITTNDFVNYEENGEAIPRGTKDDQDLFIFTGSAIEANGKYHIFYTGHNHHFANQGKPMQAVMHAVSEDLKKWTKIPEHTFYAPEDKYEKHDWRDPFVFWNNETKEYNMLLAARFKEGVSRRRGLTALCTSKDLIKWETKAPFYAPNLYFTHECPDIFKMRDWWYLVFSEFTDKVKTRYVMSKSLKGPWIIPEVDDFDSHAFYAAKTASDGTKRFLFGWNPTRGEDSDNGGWQWGGNLVVHEIYPDANGHLLARAPQPVRDAFKYDLKPGFKVITGNAIANDAIVKMKAAGSFAAALAQETPKLGRITAHCKFKKGAKEFGIMFYATDDLEKSYYIRVEPAANRVVFDRWPRVRAEVPHMAEFERPLKISDKNEVALELFVEGTKGVLYVDDKVAMNFRAYDFKEGKWGLFATDADVEFVVSVSEASGS
ncbi:MAG: DUF4975 domain-containing protein [Chitinophagaceae bacterium]|nr:DUF4975 domain-containing protein [Chitinophagaceae bacterium]